MGSLFTTNDGQILKSVPSGYMELDFVNGTITDSANTVTTMNSDLNYYGLTQCGSIAVFCSDSDVEINIGNNLEPISIKDLANRIILLTNSESEIKFISFNDSSRNRKEIINRAPDISKAEKILGYKPTISLDEGLTRVIKKYRNS